MKKYAIPFVCVLLIATVAWAALWSDYSELTAGSIASTDDVLVRDVSDTTQGPGGTLKRYTWTSINTRIAAAATDDTWQGLVMTVTVGENVAQWDLLYAKNSSGSVRWYKYDANGTDKLYAPRAIALAAINSGNAGSAGIGEGIARNDGWSQSSNADEGKPVYASGATAGAITLTAPSTSGDEVARVGYVLEENVVMFSLGNVTLVEVE